MKFEFICGTGLKKIRKYFDTEKTESVFGERLGRF